MRENKEEFCVKSFTREEFQSNPVVIFKIQNPCDLFFEEKEKRFSKTRNGT
jgi:hypothetical protein